MQRCILQRKTLDALHQRMSKAAKVPSHKPMRATGIPSNAPGLGLRCALEHPSKHWNHTTGAHRRKGNPMARGQQHKRSSPTSKALRRSRSRSMATTWPLGDATRHPLGRPAGTAVRQRRRLRHRRRPCSRPEASAAAAAPNGLPVQDGCPITGATLGRNRPAPGRSCRPKGRSSVPMSSWRVQLSATPTHNNDEVHGRAPKGYR